VVDKVTLGQGFCPSNPVLPYQWRFTDFFHMRLYRGRSRKRWQRVDAGTGQTTYTMEEEEEEEEDIYGMEARGGAVVLRHCARSRKVAGSIPDVVIGLFH
jgi:hypothetical protein